MQQIRRYYKHVELFLGQHPRAFFAAGLALVILLAVSRRPDLFFNAQFWAEDGAVWYTDAYHKDFLTTIFAPYPEYFAVPQRIIAFFSALVPFNFAPLLMNIAGFAGQLLPVVLLLGGRFKNIVGPRSLVLLLAIVYIALPNTTEVFGSFANLQWHLGLTALLVMVAEHSNRRVWKIFDWGVLIAAGLAGPLVIFLVPVAAARWWFDKKPAYRTNMLLIMGAAALQLLSIFVLSEFHRTGTPPDASLFVFAKMIVGQIFTGGLLGEDTIGLLFNHRALLYSALAAGVGLMVYAIIKGPLWLKLLNIYSPLVVVGMLITLKNPEGSTIDIWQGLTNPTGGQRYWYVSIVVWVITLVWLAFRAKHIVVRIPCALLVAVLVCIGIPQNWRISPMRDLQFQAYAKQFEAAPSGQPFSLPINPPDWKMTLYKK